MIILVVVVLSLTLTYRELVQTRTEGLHARMEGVMRVLSQTVSASTRTRVTLLRSVAADSAILAGIQRARPEFAAHPDSNVLRALQRLVPANDSSSNLPIEVWDTHGRRVAHLGEDIREDSIAKLLPEMRSVDGTRVSEIPVGTEGADSVQFGSLYASGGRVLYWVVVPVLEDGKRIGYITQQRRVTANPQMKKILSDLSGEELSLYFRNRSDDFASSLDGQPIPTTIQRDTTGDGYVVRRAGGQTLIGREMVVPGAPYLFVLESPRAAVIEGPRDTLKKIGLLLLIVAVGGVVAAWALSRQVVRPLQELASATESIALGHYASRVAADEGSSNEVQRLGDTFNRMASEVEASRKELESQFEEALAVSEQLEHANLLLQESSTEAGEARDAAVEANRAKSDFLAVMSHELRTPLNAIGGYAEILQLGIYGPVNDAQQNALIRIARSQQTLLSLINDVLNFAKLEAGQVRYEIDDVPIAASIGSLEELIAPQLHDRRMTYAVHPCDNTVTVRADPDKLQQILINLLSNAIKYSNEGGKIDVTCEAGATQVSVEVKDTGMGIAADRLGKIFDPFIQVGRALNRPHDGVGLGLSISRDLAAAMGGTLAVKSELGVGSAFTLTLARGANRTSSLA